jgi:hypothetical protein
MSKVALVGRWIAVLPGSVLCAILAQFPIHWAVMLIKHSGTEVDSDGTITYDNPISAMPDEVLEYFGNAFFTPFIIISVGAHIAPKFKVRTGIALAVLLGVVYGIVSTFVANDVSGGLYTPGRWLRLAVTVVLCIAGVVAGLFQAHRVEVAARDNPKTVA